MARAAANEKAKFWQSMIIIIYMWVYVGIVYKVQSLKAKLEEESITGNLERYDEIYQLIGFSSWGISSKKQPTAGLEPAALTCKLVT